MSGRTEAEKEHLAWWPEERERGVDREPLSRAQIVAAAIRIIDAEGLDALSMRRLGQELGAGATSLYWHVKNKDQLLDLVLDQIVGETPLDDDPDLPWRDRVAHLARGLRTVLRRHGHIAAVFGSRLAFGPNTLAGTDHLVGIFRSAGFDGVTLALAYQALLNYTSGFAILECRPVSGPGVEGRSSEEIQALVAAMFASLPATRYPNLAALSSLVAPPDVDAQFEYGLARLLDGMEAHRSGSRIQDGPERARPA